MMKFYRMCISFLLIFQSLNAQNQAVTGWVFDKLTLEVIPSAVIIDDGSKLYTESNSKGYYQLLTSNGEQKLIIAAAGYKAARIQVEVRGLTNKNVFLVPVDFDQDDSTAEFTSLYSSKTSYFKPLKRQMVQYQTMFSIADPVKLLQNLPGVSGGFEGLSSLFIRGSNADQNLLLMNGLPLYGNGHIWGLLSNYNPEIIKSAEFYRGVAPARYGNRAGGGVLDIITSGGNAEQWKGIIHADFATANIAVDGPLDKAGRWTTSLGIRRSYWDLLFSTLFQGFNDIVIGNVHDINFKLDFKQDAKTHWDFWIYNGRDKYGFKLADDFVDSLGQNREIAFEFGWKWQNTLSGFNYSHEINKRHFMNFGAGLSRYSYNNYLELTSKLTTSTNTQTNTGNYSQISSITDYNLSANFDYLLGRKTHLKYGSHWVTHDMRPSLIKNYEKVGGNIQTDTTYGTENNSLVHEFSNYAELEFHPDMNLSLNIGGRLWTFLSGEKSYVRFEPRITLNQMLVGKKRIQVGFSMSNQGIHQLSSVTGILPSDIWFPTTGVLSPQQTTQISAAYIQPLKKGFELTIEGYYKYFSGITEVEESRDERLSKNYWENMVLQGTGNSQGIELLISKRSGALNLIGSYTLSSTNRKFDLINRGESYYFRWDRTHKAALQLTYQPSESLVLNFTGVIMSGNPVTVPTGQYYTVDGKLVFDYSEKNNYRLPLYRRLDIGFTKEIHPEMAYDYRRFWGINIYNTLGFTNPLVARYTSAFAPTVGSGLKGVYYFQFVPSAFYRIEF